MLDWIKEQEIHGRVVFSIDDVRKGLHGKSENAIRAGLRRAIGAGRIQSVRPGFYVIVPPQYVLGGVVPPSYYIDALLEWMGKPYYICLLSAAAMYGAGHQRPMVTQVMTVPPRAVASGKNPYISWCYRQEVPKELLVQKNAEMGVVKYSSAELTSVDLVQFANHVGGYQRAATVLAELAPSIRPELLSAVVPYTTVAALQRLGYLLEFVLEENRLANELYAVLDGKTFKRIVMRNDQPEDTTATANRWKVNMNINIEIDEL